jgi:hypothetical protein
MSRNSLRHYLATTLHCEGLSIGRHSESEPQLSSTRSQTCMRNGVPISLRRHGEEGSSRTRGAFDSALTIVCYLHRCDRVPAFCWNP